jgi:hypothetical protein
MNVFVLCTGRCGSVTFIQACRHIHNYSSGHETRAARLGRDRLGYPPNHIEADNRLAWFLGKLDNVYGDNALYVHLRRDDMETARSFLNRYERGIINAYAKAVLIELPPQTNPLEVCRDYCDTININIKNFLKDKSWKMDFRMETAQQDFLRFWDFIGAQGDQVLALKEWEVKHNATQPTLRPVHSRP